MKFLSYLTAKIKQIVIVFSVITILPWLLDCFLGTGDNKATLIVAMPICVVLCFAFIRIVFSIMKTTKAPEKFLLFCSWFFMIGSAWASVAYIVEFLMKFPNGFSPTIGVALGIVAGVLSFNKKHSMS